MNNEFKPTLSIQSPCFQRGQQPFPSRLTFFISDMPTQNTPMLRPQIAHLIPQSALTLDDAGALGARTVGDKDVTGFAPVEILRDTAGGIYVSGLAEEAKIIVVGQEFVTDGVVVAPTYREPIQ